MRYPDWPWGYLKRERLRQDAFLEFKLVNIPAALLPLPVSPFMVNEEFNGKDFIPQLHDEKRCMQNRS